MTSAPTCAATVVCAVVCRPHRRLTPRSPLLAHVFHQTPQTPSSGPARVIPTWKRRPRNPLRERCRPRSFPDTMMADGWRCRMPCPGVWGRGLLANKARARGQGTRRRRRARGLGAWSAGPTSNCDVRPEAWTRTLSGRDSKRLVRRERGECVQIERLDCKWRVAGPFSRAHMYGTYAACLMYA